MNGSAIPQTTLDVADHIAASIGVVTGRLKLDAPAEDLVGVG